MNELFNFLMSQVEDAYKLGLSIQITGKDKNGVVTLSNEAALRDFLDSAEKEIQERLNGLLTGQENLFSQN